MLRRGQRLKKESHSGVQNRPSTLVFVVIKLPDSPVLGPRSGRGGFKAAEELEAEE